jgi:two-component system, sensor histidine kinase PdtaS
MRSSGVLLFCLLPELRYRRLSRPQGSFGDQWSGAASQHRKSSKANVRHPTYLIWINVAGLSPSQINWSSTQPKADSMTSEQLLYADPSPIAVFDSRMRRTVASYERELTRHRLTEIRLRKALCREESLLSEKDALIQQQKVLNEEADHRLLNGLQMIVSLLWLQSRASPNAEAASQLAVAANRVATIERVHRRLHCLDGVKTVAFEHYLEDLCDDFSAMLSTEGKTGRTIMVEGIDIQLPSVTAIPLGFIVNELITNAVKHGEGEISVRLSRNAEAGYSLSVGNDGAALPEGFDPAACTGLGMKIIRSLVRQIGGELRMGPGDGGEGARFTVLFS